MRRALALVPLAALLVAGPLLAPSTTGQAQEGCLPPILTLPPGPWVFEPGEPAGLFVNLENPNGAPVDALQVSLDVGYPEGWSATLAQREFSLGPKNATMTGLSVTAPSRGSGSATGNVTVSASAACVAGSIITPRVTAARSVPVGLTMSTVPWFAIGLGAIGAILLSILFVALEVRRGGIRLTCDEPEKFVKPGKGVSFPLTLQNRGKHLVQVRLTVPDLPEGWKAHLALGEINLEARQTQELWVMVRIPRGAEFGEERSLTIRANPVTRPKDGVEVPVRVKVSPLRA